MTAKDATQDAPDVARIGYTTPMLVTLATALLLSGCGVGEAAVVAEEAAPEPPAVPVEVTGVARGDVEATYSVTAVLEAEVESRITSRVQGDVLAILVEEGDLVSAGQLLARLDTRRIELQARRIQANVDRISNELQRAHGLYAQGLISEEEYDRLRFDLQATRAELESVLLDESYAEIRAPVAGIVSQRAIKLGNHLMPGDHAFTVTQLDTIEARVQVPQNEQGRIAAGQTVRLGFDALPGRVFSGTVERVNPVIDSTTGTFSVIVVPDAEAGELMPGMFGRVDIVYDQHEDALLVPAYALRQEDDLQLLYVVQDGIAQRREVQLGYRQDGHVEVLSGVAEGESIVILGQEQINDGTRVTARSVAGA